MAEPSEEERASSELPAGTPAGEQPAEAGGAGRVRVEVRRAGAVRIIAVAGELDHDSVDGLRAALAAPVAQDGVERVVVDFGGVTFCDSTGLNLLLRARLDAVAAGLRLDVAGLRPAVARLFQITGADTVLRIQPDLAAALADPGGEEG
ncbi:STAS domain-containing protein [Kitasatospora sp. MMS16-BH015]|uniref:STAS domain-containing protein n=1 Tax=Kitasatospora sp. MMS16-BH015 TaxID=2018025 RepID=UPI000CF2C534|nr:STAS domain-containing protein [Kitasatospora sp. MMS16-BH015]